MAFEGVAKLRAVIGPPTLVVASGGTSTNPKTGEVQAKLHAHWRLNEPTQTEEEHRFLKHARALACDFVGADASSKPAVHPIRWAGTLHRKNPHDPRCVEIIEENFDSEISIEDVVSELEGLAVLHGSAEDAGASAGSSTADPTGDADLLMECAERIANPDLDWTRWNRLGMAFWRASDGSEEGLAAFEVFSCKSTKYDPEATRARWEHYRTSPPDRSGVRTLVYEARKADPGFRERKSKPHPGHAEGNRLRIPRPCQRRCPVRHQPRRPGARHGSEVGRRPACCACSGGGCSTPALDGNETSTCFT